MLLIIDYIYDYSVRNKFCLNQLLTDIRWFNQFMLVTYSANFALRCLVIFFVMILFLCRSSGPVRMDLEYNRTGKLVSDSGISRSLIGEKDVQRENK